MRRPMAALLLAAIVGGWWTLAQLGFGPASEPAAQSDNCRQTEDAVRRIWVESAIHASNPAQQIDIARQYVLAAEDGCRRDRDAKIVALPPELRALAR